MARRSTPERSRARAFVSFQSASGVGGVRRRRQDRRGKQRAQEHPGVTWCADGMILERHTESLKHLEPMHVDELCDLLRAREKCRMRAYGEVYLYRRARLSSGPFVTPSVL